MKTVLAFCLVNPAIGLGRWWRSLLALVLVAAVAVGCGGGGGSTSVAGVGSGGTGSFTSGPITGFGSIIVNGIRFDESAASASGSIKDDDGVVGSSGSLKLGMVVNVTGSSIDNSSTVPAATATAVTFVSEYLGAITAISTTTKTLVLLGKTIAVTGSTFFDDNLQNGFADLKAGMLVEVYGFYDSVSSVFTATRIEQKSASTDTKLIGEVTNLNTASSTFALGLVTVSYATIKPVTLANGQVVRVKGVFNKAGVLEASRVRLQEFGAQSIGVRDDAKVEGVVDPFTSAVSFSVNGVKVDARNAVVSGGVVAQGVRVEVEGSTTSDSVLVARKVTVKTSSQVDMGEFRITDVVTNLTPASKTFLVRGVKVDYSGTLGAVDYRGGVEADLGKTPAPTIEVTGMRSVSTGSLIVATRIKFNK